MRIRYSSLKKITPPEAVAGVSNGEQVKANYQQSSAGQCNSFRKVVEIHSSNILALALGKKALGGSRAECAFPRKVHVWVNSKCEMGNAVGLPMAEGGSKS